MLTDDSRVILTLDAGGTKFSFSAIAGAEEIVSPIERPSYANDLPKCLKNITDGFSEVLSQVKKKPSAISFAFPGPAYYQQGVIGDLGNLPAFRGGVPLGPILQNTFNLPVFINNDGDLFTLGEAFAGFLPMVNRKLKEKDSPKQFSNLTGFTLGTGLGGGIVQNGMLFAGDNSAAGEVWLMRNNLHIHTNIEESVSIRALQRVYRQNCGEISDINLTAKDIYLVAKGEKPGNKQAAQKSFAEMGKALGECIRNVVTITDSLVVLGGGLSAAYDLFSESMLVALRSKLHNYEQSSQIPGLEISCFNLHDTSETEIFLKGDIKEIRVPGTNQNVVIDALKRTGIGTSVLGTSKAVAIGAWVFGLKTLDSKF